MEGNEKPRVTAPEPRPGPGSTNNTDDECEYRLNAELKKEVETFVKSLAKKYNLQLLSFETDLFGNVCRINWWRTEK